MIIKEKYIYKIDGEEYEGTFSYEDSGKPPMPAILIAPTYSGPSPLEEEKAEYFASLGYFTFIIDLYGKGKRGSNPEESTKLMDELSSNRSILSRRINFCLDLLKGHSYVDNKRIAAVGYCFGGKCVLDLARSGAEVNLIISLHGIYDRPNINNPKSIVSPVLILHGDEDPFAKPGDLEKLVEELRMKKAHWNVHIFGGIAHAFTNPNANNYESGMYYDQNSDLISCDIIQTYLRTNLKI